MVDEICTIINFHDLISIFQNVYKIDIKKLSKDVFAVIEITILSNMSFAWPEFLECRNGRYIFQKLAGLWDPSALL